MLKNFDVHNCSPEELKQSGAHYTPMELSYFVAAQMLSELEINDKKHIKILDPAVGDGDLLYALVALLKNLGVKKLTVFGFDTNTNAIEKTKVKFKEYEKEFNLQFKSCDFLLESETIEEKFDLVISNPPYVRTQVLGADVAQDLSKRYGLKGRVDLYYTFFPAIKNVMADNAILGIITSNRFMTTKAGKSVREYISSNYSILKVWDLGDTKVFDAAVLPCVLTLKNSIEFNHNIEFISAYTNESSDKTKKTATGLVDLLDSKGTVTYNGATYNVKNGHLLLDRSDLGMVWAPKDEETLEVLEKIASKTWCTFKDVGKIRVGIKTTADNVFISDDWDAKIEDEVLKQTTTHHGARRWAPDLTKMTKKTLYTHCFNEEEEKKMAIKLDRFPGAKAYLKSHFDQLNSRSYIHKSKRKWFEIWVPQDPRAWSKPKLVFRDIAERPTFWIDEKGSVVNGDCYWMTVDKMEGNEDMLWLSMAIANSDFSKYFYEVKFNNKLYSGRCRFMTQYVELFPLPNPELTLSKDIIKLSKKASKAAMAGKDNKVEEIEEDINLKVWEAFDLKSFKFSHKSH